MATSLSDMETGKIKGAEHSDLPPSYGAATNYTPPSYRSICPDPKKIKNEIKNEPAYNNESSKTAFELCFTIVSGSVILAVLAAIPITMIVMGSLYLHDCPAERYIPIYLIVAGAFALFFLLWIMYNFEWPKEDQKGLFCGILGGLVSVFLVAWIIAGNFWVYRTYGKWSPDETTLDYCHPTLYKFAFWLTTFPYIVTGVILLAIYLKNKK